MGGLGLRLGRRRPPQRRRHGGPGEAAPKPPRRAGAVGTRSESVRNAATRRRPGTSAVYHQPSGTASTSGPRVRVSLEGGARCGDARSRSRRARCAPGRRASEAAGRSRRRAPAPPLPPPPAGAASRPRPRPRPDSRAFEQLRPGRGGASRSARLEAARSRCQPEPLGSKMKSSSRGGRPQAELVPGKGARRPNRPRARGRAAAAGPRRQRLPDLEPPGPPGRVGEQHAAPGPRQHDRGRGAGRTRRRPAIRASSTAAAYRRPSRKRATLVR